MIKPNRPGKPSAVTVDTVIRFIGTITDNGDISKLNPYKIKAANITFLNMLKIFLSIIVHLLVIIMMDNLYL